MKPNEDNKSISEADALTKRIEVVEGHDYVWVSDYSEFVFERTTKIYGILDD